MKCRRVPCRRCRTGRRVPAHSGSKPWIATAHFAVTVLVVVVTANHYWIDWIVALMLLAGVALVIRHPGPDRNAPAERDSVLQLPHGDR